MEGQAWFESQVSFLKVQDQDLSLEGWRSAPPLQEPRAGLGATCVLGSIFVVGGCRGPEDLGSVERYTPGGCWELVTRLPAPRRACCAVASGSSVLVLGGVRGAGDAVGALARYDARRGAWRPTEAALQGSRRYFAACACRLGQVNSAESDIKCVVS